MDGAAGRLAVVECWGMCRNYEGMVGRGWTRGGRSKRIGEGANSVARASTKTDHIAGVNASYAILSMGFYTATSFSCTSTPAATNLDASLAPPLSRPLETTPGPPVLPPFAAKLAPHRRHANQQLVSSAMGGAH